MTGGVDIDKAVQCIFSFPLTNRKTAPFQLTIAGSFCSILKECKKYFLDFYLLLIKLLQQRKHLLHFSSKTTKNALRSDTDLSRVGTAKLVWFLVTSASDNGSTKSVYGYNTLHKINY